MPLHSSLLVVVVEFGVILGIWVDCGTKGASLGVGALRNVVGVLGWVFDTSTRGASNDDMMIIL